MNKSRVIKAAIVIVILLVLVWAALRIFGKQSEPLLSREQAEQAVLNEYPGKVGSLELQAGQYIAELQTVQGWYKLKLDGATGEIISIVLLKHTVEPVVQPTPSVSGALPGGAAASPSPSPPPTPSPSAQRVVSEDEAVRLALQEVPGKPDDVDTGINESGAYYLVEIKTSDGREAVVQVNAISGGIMSVTWEEPDGGNS
ncbi:PepSY domain-containing protein [Paenibacillus tritici]|uniref:PepSY domain-containing protein n=2 Tax=Paenibacillus tritici TaxID=1873425 RepID=A0ABX2DSA5_9BACL|nr:PepSY domain-containing protein [Paenibacillus tritici]QUL58002.1 PepSY domain-containing protein [Paenibacillus tritici]